MTLCVFKDDRCDICGAPRINARQLCGTWRHDVVPPVLPTYGPGTELKKLLARVGITATPDCSCNARAAEMDRQGVEWCEANLDTIVGWLREQAEARGLPFLDLAGRLLVRRAISNARKAAGGSYA
jgi:hypothetical protein